jgi:Flp pilus assembly protein TadB
MEHFILQWWPIILGVLAFVSWLLRLEAQVKQNKEDNKQTREEMKRVERTLKEQRSEDISERRAEFNEVRANLVIIQNDIKSLIGSQNVNK